MSHGSYYRRDLPHWQPPGAVFFITFRTFGSLPKSVEEKLKEDAAVLKRSLYNLPGDAPELVAAWKKLFKYADDSLEKSNQALHLAQPDTARIVMDSIYKGEELGHYRLHRYCIMGNHVHLLIEPLPENSSCAIAEIDHALWPPVFYTDEGRSHLLQGREPKELHWRKLSSILKSMKGATSRRIGQVLDIDGPVWKDESYDHWVRNGGEYERITDYIDNNPVKAGLCSEPRMWVFSSSGQKGTLSSR